MLSKILSCTLNGIDGDLVECEADLTSGLPAFSIVGLPDAAVKESKDRIRAAIGNSGMRFPAKRITVNLSPADTKKTGSHFDLPIAAAIAAAEKRLSYDRFKGMALLGELSLDGRLQRVNGILPMLIVLSQMKVESVIIPHGNMNEAVLMEGMKIIPAKHLAEVMAFMEDGSGLEAVKPAPAYGEVGEDAFPCDYSEVYGQENAKRALEISAAGNHNLLMIGPPGSGKTMLARRFPTILPPLDEAQALEVTKIYSIAGLMKNRSFIRTRPFRSPHHTLSSVSLTGGGNHPKPGEISLANHGVLYLDELPEFRRGALEALRQPLEDGKVTITRVQSTVTYPSNFILIASMNPCPCGYYGDSRHACKCSVHEIRRYMGRISGPILDRMDLHVEVPGIGFEDLQQRSGMRIRSSKEMRESVLKARERQSDRFNRSRIKTNGEMDNRQLKRYCTLDGDSKALLKSAFDHMGLSARSYGKIVKIARTIADLEGRDAIERAHLMEALSYRNLETKYWTL